MPESPEIHYLTDPYGNLTPEAMERYLAGELSDKEHAAVERHLVESPFDREALDGLSKQLKGSFRNDLGELDESVLAKAREKAVSPPPQSLRPYYWVAAAGVTALVGLTILLIYLLKDPPEHQLAVSGQRSTVSGQQSAVSGQQSAVSSQQSAVSSPESGTTGTTGTGGTLEQPSDKLVFADDEDVPVTEQDTIEDAIIIAEEPEEVEAFAVAVPNDDTIKEEGAIFLVVESMPEFPGGEDAFNKYLSDSLHYPAAAVEASIQGRVFVTFVVEIDGSISDARILRGIGGGCDEEALRVISNMPKWAPGKQRGKPVRVQYNLPIKFTLEGNKSSEF